MPRVFENVGIPKVPRSLFNLSHSKVFTCNLGKWYPTMAVDVVPGDIFDISKNVVVRFQPLLAPVLHEVYLKEYTFFVPYRILMDDDVYSGDAGKFEEMIIGGTDGDTEIAIPAWNPSSTGVGSLWEAFGLPLSVNPTGFRPMDMLKRAYNMIWNEYCMDIDLDTALTIETAEDVQGS